MIDYMTASINTPDETLQKLIGSQILRFEYDGLAMSPSIKQNVTSCFKRGAVVVIHFNNAEQVLSFTNPVEITYYPEGNLR